MRHALIALGTCLLSLVGNARAGDDPGCKDPPLFNRLADFEIDSCEATDFDAHEFVTAQEKDVLFEGRRRSVHYCLREGGRERSFLEVGRNYGNALAKLGGTSEYHDGFNAHFHLARDGKEVWVHVSDSGGSCYTLHVVEKEAMVQEIEAGAMLEALNTQGFVALYINFDVNRASIKPDSQRIVEQVAQLLRSSPGLKVSVEGHTDATGTPAANKKLSRDRAAAVVAALVERGIAAGRLAAVGWGQEKPLADDRTEEGRARNRRVEIVKR